MTFASIDICPLCQRDLECAGALRCPNGHIQPNEAVLLEAELERLRAERAKAHSALKEIRLRLHTAGRRPEECYEMRLIDGVLL